MPPVKFVPNFEKLYISRFVLNPATGISLKTINNKSTKNKAVSLQTLPLTHQNVRFPPPFPT